MMRKRHKADRSANACKRCQPGGAGKIATASTEISKRQ
jgi:hypothetical protein